ncbi:MAG: hypothetical protein ACI4J6_05755 [Oscillospiraceae bacterium]
MISIENFANCDNEIIDVKRISNEYEITIRKWDYSMIYLQTINCREIEYNSEIIPEIGDIDIENNVYSFKCFCSEDDEDDNVILHVITDGFLIKK